MCGLAGVVDRLGSAPSERAARVRSMLDALVHRGPDDAGDWASSTLPVALGLRRLAIIDLSPAGHQPMHSADGRWALVFNGELFNFRAMRADLAREGATFRSSSDTEVFVESFARWGVQETLVRSNGMYAFAAVDTLEARLYLGRDRLGEKPLFFAATPTSLLFASEVKALRTDPSFAGALDPAGMLSVLRHGYVAGPGSIYSTVAQVPPGSVCEWSIAALSAGHTVEEYWSPLAVAREGLADPFPGSAEEAEREVAHLLRDAVARRMVADVPVGAFLSGGIDSSAAVAAMVDGGAGPVRTFTVGYGQGADDESSAAALVASALGTEHHHLDVSADDVLSLVPELPRLFDEPFADAAAIPTVLLSRFARERVTVALGGDGGDELFGGYDHHRFAAGPWAIAERIPAGLRRPIGRALAARAPAARLRAAGDVLSMHDVASLHARLTSQWKAPSELLRGHPEETPRIVVLPPADTTRRMMFLDLVGYLPDDILVKTDRATMSASVEGRLPFLDPELVAFSWRLPTSFLVDRRRGKKLLRNIVERRLGPAVARAPKRGFSVPLAGWLRGPLRSWAEELLSSSDLDSAGLVPEPIRGRWRQHLTGDVDSSHYLWNVLMLMGWLRT